MPGIRLLTIGATPERYALVQLHWTQFMFGVAFWRIAGGYDSWHLMIGPLQFEYAYRRKDEAQR